MSVRAHSGRRYVAHVYIACLPSFIGRTRTSYGRLMYRIPIEETRSDFYVVTNVGNIQIRW